MFEFILGILFAWWFIPGLLFIDYFCIRGEAFGWSIFFTLVILILSYFTFSIPATYIIGFIILYIPIGIAWSLHRFDKYCKNLKDNGEPYKLCYSPKYNSDKIVGWIIAWPLSLIDTLLGDIVDVIELIVKKYLLNLYTKISQKYIGVE